MNTNSGERGSRLRLLALEGAAPLRTPSRMAERRRPACQRPLSVAVLTGPVEPPFRLSGPALPWPDSRSRIIRATRAPFQRRGPLRPARACRQQPAVRPSGRFATISLPRAGDTRPQEESATQACPGAAAQTSRRPGTRIPGRRDLAGVPLTSNDNQNTGPEPLPASIRRKPGLVVCLALAACLQLALLVGGLFRQQAPPRDALVLPSVGATVTTPPPPLPSPPAITTTRQTAASSPAPSPFPSSHAEGDLRPDLPPSASLSPHASGNIGPAPSSPTGSQTRRR